MSTVSRPITEEDKQKWVKALRSGKYKQGKKRLRSANQYGIYYCCLGVAKKVCKPEVDSPLELVKKDERGRTTMFIPMEQQSFLVTMNDDQEKDFNEIADWIEENVPTTL